MDKESAVRLVNQTLNASFDKERFANFSRNLFNSLDDSTFSYHGAYIPEAYKPFISKYERIGKYSDPLDNQIDVLVVHLQRGAEARTMQRNFVANYLNGGRGGQQKDAALVAFVTPDQADWRLSLVKMEYKDFGKTKELTPARRYSFLVGANENSHTARQQLIPYLMKSDDILLTDLINAFNVEKVSKEFFDKYKELFLLLKESIDDIAKKDSKVKADFEAKSVNTADFAKKLLGQIVFLYFLQKKGWLGVNRDNSWGSGPKGFLRALFDKKFVDYKNFFNDVLEPLFYEALAVERTEHYYDHLKSKIPFLNGGLFEPINDYDWVHTDIPLPNDLFSNTKRTKEGDVGSGILDIFDRYNFTVKEDEPLEKEVAVDPEMLGKVFENLLEIIDRKSKGSYYTPREIVHYMCQESLINYLTTELPEVPREDLSEFIKHSDLSVENDAQVQRLGSETPTYKYKLPSTIRKNAQVIDEKLADIKICDPAIGSGAFPVGMMNEIVRARESLTSFIDKPNRTAYEFKRHAIQESLYGVDIDPGAVEIAKLRLWLSLVVDENDIKQIKPLPNLDYKVMQGNSLLEEFQGIKLYDDSLLTAGHNAEADIAEMRSQVFKLQNEYITLHNSGDLTADKKKILDKQLQSKNKLLKSLIKSSEAGKVKPENAGLFDMASEAKQKADELKSLHHKFFMASHKSLKDELRKRIDELEWDLIEASLKEQSRLESLPLIEKYRQANVKPFFLWRLHFSEVFLSKGGFDVLIANPPYVGEKGNKEIFREVRQGQLGTENYQGKMDLFYYFFHLALYLLKNQGVASFISTNYYLTATGAIKLRRALKNNATLLELIDFNELKIFESALGQHNIITQFYKGSEDSESRTTIVKGTKPTSPDFISDVLSRNSLSAEYYDINQTDLFEGPELFIRLRGKNEASKLFSALSKAEAQGTPLGELCNINRGVDITLRKITRKHLEKYPNLNLELGENVFALTTEDIKLKGISGEPVKDYVKSTDIVRFGFKENNSKLLYMTWTTSIEALSSIKNHLEKYKSILLDQMENYGENYPWFALHRPRNERIFLSPRILVPYRSLKNTFGYAEDPLYGSDDVYFITAKDERVSLKYVLAVLNSKLYYWWFYYKGKRKGEILELYQQPLSYAPIKVISQIQQRQFIALADDCIRSQKLGEDISAQESKLNRLVYELYELTEDEIAEIESQELVEANV